MTMLTNEELQTKAAVLTALSNAYNDISEDILPEVQFALNKLALELSKEVRGLTL